MMTVAKTSSQIKQGKVLMPWRRVSVLVVLVCAMAVLVARALDMQVMHSKFFEQQGDARQLRTVTIPANRGDIVDRNGEPFAISTPVNSVWLNPQTFNPDDQKLKQLAKLLSMDWSITLPSLSVSSHIIIRSLPSSLMNG